MKRIKVNFEEIAAGDVVSFFRSDLDKIMFFTKPTDEGNFIGAFYHNDQVEYIGHVSQEFIRVALDISNRNLNGEDVGYYLAVDQPAPAEFFQRLKEVA